MFRVGWVVATLVLLSETGRAQEPSIEPTEAHQASNSQNTNAREVSIALSVGLGRRPTTEEAARGLAYGLDVQLQWWRAITLDVGCDQFVSDQGLTRTRVRVWSTACGVAAGLGYRARSFFAGAALGADVVASAQSVRFVGAVDRSWALFGLARIQAHAYYVYGRARFGAIVKVRLGRFARRDTRFLLSIGWNL